MISQNIRFEPLFSVSVAFSIILRVANPLEYFERSETFILVALFCNDNLARRLLIVAKFIFDIQCSVYVLHKSTGSRLVHCNIDLNGAYYTPCTRCLSSHWLEGSCGECYFTLCSFTCLWSHNARRMSPKRLDVAQRLLS